VGDPGLDISVDVKAKIGGGFSAGYDVSVLPNNMPQLVTVAIGVGVGAEVEVSVGGSYNFVLGQLCSNWSVRPLDDACDVGDNAEYSVANEDNLIDQIPDLEAFIEDNATVSEIQRWSLAKSMIAIDSAVPIADLNPMIIRSRINPDYCLTKDGDKRVWDNGKIAELKKCEWNWDNYSVVSTFANLNRDINVSPKEVWYFDNNTMYIRSFFNPLKCLHKKGSSSNWNNGTTIHVWDCDKGGVENKTWSYDIDTGYIHAFKNSALCLQIENSNWSNNNPIVLNDCETGDEEWKSWDMCEIDNIVPTDHCFGGRTVSTSTMNYHYSDQFGGTGGDLFDDAETTLIPEGSGLQPIKVMMRSGSRLDKVGLKFASPVKWLKHGGSGGGITKTAIEIDPLMQVKVCRDYTSKYNATTIHSIELTLASGAVMTGGTETNDCQTFSSPEGYPIVGFHGHSGTEVDKLGVIYGEKL